MSERLLGVVGTLVHDTIHRRDVRDAPVVEWGGIGYALEALEASLGEGWRVRPILRVGQDLSEEAFRYLRSIPRVDDLSRIEVVPETNNRVEIVYTEGDRRTEHLSGGVGPWEPDAVAEAVADCDALLVNFISGFEMGLDAARRLRTAVDGPVWADLHSLFLGVGEAGRRVPQELDHAGEWLRCFDAVQMNEDEFRLLAGPGVDPWELAARCVGRDLGLIVVTLGPEGAACVRDSDLPGDPFAWAGRWTGLGPAAQAVTTRIPAEPGAGGGDPTGCGDVWGATTFARILAGDSVRESMVQGNRMAARNLEHRGAVGLHHHLRGRIAPGGRP